MAHPFEWPAMYTRDKSMLWDEADLLMTLRIKPTSSMPLEVDGAQHLPEFHDDLESEGQGILKVPWGHTTIKPLCSALFFQPLMDA
jgi:hypothetical protein